MTLGTAMVGQWCTPGIPSFLGCVHSVLTNRSAFLLRYFIVKRIDVYQRYLHMGSWTYDCRALILIVYENANQSVPSETCATPEQSIKQSESRYE
jgi:hypothetical protein